MATGVPANRDNIETLTAEVPHKNPYNYDYIKETELFYPKKSKKSEILKPINSDFVQIKKDHVMTANIKPNDLVLCDNIYGIHAMIKNKIKVNLIYIDPPYNTGFGFQSRELEHAYNDNYSLSEYVEYMRVRLILMREILADSGSIYVHIGHQMLAHLKIIMDEVFGSKNFRNIITRRKCSSKNFTKHQYPNLNDFILFYSKTDSYTWNKPTEKPTDEWINKEYNKRDERGQYKLVPIHAPGVRNGETGMEWMGMLPPKGKHWQYTPEKLDELNDLGLIYWSKTGNPRKKVYLENSKTIPVTDYWANFRDAHHQSISITGYPTEKNINMIKMIIEANSNKGDLIFDPFCGSGTTLQAASELDRNWIGMDQSFLAIHHSFNRLKYGSKPMGSFSEHDKPPQLGLDLPKDIEFRLLADLDTFKKNQESIFGILN